MLGAQHRLRSCFLAAAMGLWATLTLGQAAGARAIQIRQGYFWDPQVGQFFLPRGFAYQTWNPPVGANQSFEQIDYDLLEFKKMHANSVRCEFVWSQVQVGPEEWDWTKPDHLIAQAEKLGLKLFVIIGFQYPPEWFPAEWRAIHDQGLTPEVLECLQQHPGSVTNCLPQPLYDQLFTNNLPTEVLTATLGSLTSGIPSEIMSAVQQRVPPEFRPRVMSALVSDVLNYEHPAARRAYTNHIAKVAARYRNSSAIGAWIMGNECAYFDLWEDFRVFRVHRFLGYDSDSQTAFRNYLRELYQENIAVLNSNWRTAYPDFASVRMPGTLPADRNLPSLTDLIRWRQKSIAGFIAAGAQAARSADPNHLLTYSMVGGIFNGNDANNTCEDAPAIVAACRQAGAPLDFWSINNYALASLGSELRTGDFGISKFRELLKLPVMISETGHTSTEDLFPGAALRQAKALPGQIWESLLSGAIGTHIFHWNDRSQFTRGYFNRERGFGIVNENRTIKDPVYWNVVAMFRRMREVELEKLLCGSRDPATDVQFYWSQAGDLSWPRANQENAMMWGALRRLGFHPGILNDAQFRLQAYTNAPALLLSRAWQLDREILDAVANKVVASGIHVHANADLPGQVDAYLRPNPAWADQIRDLFGLDVSNAFPAFDSGAISDSKTLLAVFGAANFGSLAPSYAQQLITWKIWHDVRAVAGKTVLVQTGLDGTQQSPRVPALQLHQRGLAKTAASTFPFGDSYSASDDPTRSYEIRYDLLRTVYRDHFRLQPTIDISGPGAKRVISDYRTCPNGSVLISVLNEDVKPTTITLASPLLANRTIENLTAGGLIARSSLGTLNVSLSGDEYLLLYCYSASSSASDSSLINPGSNKLWFGSAPLTVWAGSVIGDVEVGYDLDDSGALNLTLSLERISPSPRTMAQSAPASLQGNGTRVLTLQVPDPDLGEPEYLSSAAGGQYVFRATLSRDELVFSQTSLPVRLAWGVKPASLFPADLVAGARFQLPVEWNELPSYLVNDPTPFDRPRLWDSLAAQGHYFNIRLELQDTTGVVAASEVLSINRGTGEDTLAINVPPTAQPPFVWRAFVESAPHTMSVGWDDGFEGRDRGEDLSPFKPWFAGTFGAPNAVALLSQGIKLQSGPLGANQVAYVSVQSSTNSSSASGFYLIQGGEPWALPANRVLWSNYVFSCDFKEASGLPCTLELQLKDVAGNWLAFTKPYQPSPNGWDSIRASLAQFGSGPSAGRFDPTRVRDWVLNVQMLRQGAHYEGFFDNVLCSGPRLLQDDFENRPEGEFYSRISPWSGYGYDARGHSDIKLNQGVGLAERSEGSQAAFLVAWYRVDSWEFAGFGITYSFPKPCALPPRLSDWSHYTLAFDFKERFAQPCILELQLTSPDTLDADGLSMKHAIHFQKVYTPGSNQWDTISATLAQFVQPEYFAAFDPTQVSAIVLNVQMLERSPLTNVLYVGWFDHVQFHAPVTPGPGESILGAYSSEDDSFRIDPLRRGPTSLTISWTGTARLEWADQVEGPWSENVDAFSPVTIAIDRAQRYYRLRRR